MTSNPNGFVVCMPYVAITLLTVALTNFKWSLSCIFLNNLTVYKIPDQNMLKEQQEKASNNGVKPPSAARQRKNAAKNNSKLKERMYNQLAIAATSKEGLMQRMFFTEYDKLVFFFVAVSVNLCAFQVLSYHREHQGGGAVLTCLALVALGTGIVSLLTTQLQALVSPRAERITSVLVGTASALAAILLLVLVPREVLDFEVEAAAAALTTSLQTMLMKVDMSNPIGEVPVLYLQIFLAIMAGLIGGVTVAPAVRSVRCYMVATSPPEWAEAHLGEPMWIKLLLHLNIVLPMAITVLWVKPLLEQPLQISQHLTMYLQIGASFFASVLQLSLIRPQVQSYLDSGLVAWYERVFGVQGAHVSTAERDFQNTGVRLMLELNSTLICKVAVQTMAPAVMLLSCAALLWHKGMETMDMHPTSMVPPVVFKAVFSFLLWFYCVVWSTVAGTTLALFRVGYILHY